MKNVSIIGISGLAGSGKDTLADMLYNLMDYESMAFADPIKDMLSTGLNISLDHFYAEDKEVLNDHYGVTIRHMIQTLGTEWGRRYVGEDIWINAMESRIKTLAGADKVVVTDIRFENEAAWVREHGTLIHIYGRGGIDTSHSSESGIKKLDTDLNIDNSGSISDLEDQLVELKENNFI